MDTPTANLLHDYSFEELVKCRETRLILVNKKQNYNV